MIDAERRRVDRAKALWADVVASGYLDADPAVPLADGIYPLLPALREFLSQETVTFADRPNLMTSFLRTLLFIPGMESGAATALQRLNEGMQPNPSGYIAASGTYSSVYAGLLALVADHAQVMSALEGFLEVFEGPAAQALTRRIVAPGPVFWLKFYRGQSHDWPALPKTLRPRGWIGALTGAAVDGVRAARFDYAVASARNNAETLAADPRTALRQHSGFPTSMLDFTENIEVAAFFATRNATPGDTGVIYRYHLAHPWALDVRASLASDIPEVADVADGLRSLTIQGLQPLKPVMVPGVQRIERQAGVFIDGIGVAEAHAFMQPVYFRQHEGVAYVDSHRQIDESCLFPKDDPLEILAMKYRGKA